MRREHSPSVQRRPVCTLAFVRAQCALTRGICAPARAEALLFFLFFFVPTLLDFWQNFAADEARPSLRRRRVIISSEFKAWATRASSRRPIIGRRRSGRATGSCVARGACAQARGFLALAPVASTQLVFCYSPWDPPCAHLLSRSGLCLCPALVAVCQRPEESGASKRLLGLLHSCRFGVGNGAQASSRHRVQLLLGARAAQTTATTSSHLTTATGLSDRLQVARRRRRRRRCP